MRTGTADLPLHYGKAPAWLFSRMRLLAREIACFVAADAGVDEFLRKMSDPFWFQAFGCVLGFDWHSSGVTTTVCGALKEGLKGLERDLGFWVAGGKGATSRRTPAEIEAAAGFLRVQPAELVYASRMAAKVDNNALQDGYQIYHHCFLFTAEGKWAVVQQGMDEASRYARRYHWLGETVTDFVSEPEAAICCDRRGGRVLNLVAAESAAVRSTLADLAREPAGKLVTDLSRVKALKLPAHHHVSVGDINPDRIGKILLKTYEAQPAGFEELLGLEGVGPKTIRALSLIAELVYGVPPSFSDPARFSFAHGGKDGHPYPVDRTTYDRSIEFLRRAVAAAKVGRSEKVAAFRRLEKV